MTKPIFCNMPTDQGYKYVNISNIASIDSINNKTFVTLNVKNKENIYISFFVNLDWGWLTGEINRLLAN